MTVRIRAKCTQIVELTFNGWSGKPRVLLEGPSGIAGSDHLIASDWLTKAWSGAKRRGLDAMTPDEINAEIAAHRHEKESAGREAK